MKICAVRAWIVKHLFIREKTDGRAKEATVILLYPIQIVCVFVSYVSR